MKGMADTHVPYDIGLDIIESTLDITRTDAVNLADKIYAAAKNNTNGEVLFFTIQLAMIQHLSFKMKAMQSELDDYKRFPLMGRS